MISKEDVYLLHSCDSHGSRPAVICEYDNIRISQNVVQNKLTRVTILSNRTWEVHITHVGWDTFWADCKLSWFFPIPPDKCL